MRLPWALTAFFDADTIGAIFIVFIVFLRFFMAVQKSRVTHSKRGMRRSHDGLTTAALSVDGTTGETHRRHHITKNGYYRGRQVVEQKMIEEETETENS